jgi:hypothetical protein
MLVTLPPFVEEEEEEEGTALFAIWRAAGCGRLSHSWWFRRGV